MFTACLQSRLSKWSQEVVIRFYIKVISCVCDGYYNHHNTIISDQTPSPYAGQSAVQFGGVYRTIPSSPSPNHHATPSPPLEYGAVGGWAPPAMVAGPSVTQPPPDHTTLSSLLDMDSQQLTQLNSAELSGLSSLLEGTYQPNPYQPSFRQDTRMNVDQENMTDSFTRLTTNAINELTGGNGLTDHYARQN